MTTNPTILAIDTSCDETSVAVTKGKTILSNVIASQAQLHKQYGGVFPTVAKQAHQENIDPTVLAALHRAHLDWKSIDAIAVTQGPGLAPALEVGLKRAEEMAEAHNKPLILINHIEGHLLSVLAERRNLKGEGSNKQGKSSSKSIAPKFPALAVIASGGHTEFILVEKIGKYRKIGQTVDDAAGECLDKVGRMLDLGYPAGPVVEKIAELGDAKRFPFPLPMTTTKTFDLSFSGLKTHAKNAIDKLKKNNQLDKQATKDFAAGLQAGVIRHIVYKLEKALNSFEGQQKNDKNKNKGYPQINSPKPKELWLGGGVAANLALRKELRQLAKQFNLEFRVPYDKKLCGDNAAMIGVVAGFKMKAGMKTAPSSPQTTPQITPKKLDRKPRWSIEEI